MPGLNAPPRRTRRVWTQRRWGQRRGEGVQWGRSSGGGSTGDLALVLWALRSASAKEMGVDFWVSEWRKEELAREKEGGEITRVKKQRNGKERNADNHSTAEHEMEGEGGWTEKKRSHGMGVEPRMEERRTDVRATRAEDSAVKHALEATGSSTTQLAPLVLRIMHPRSGHRRTCAVAAHVHATETPTRCGPRPPMRPSRARRSTRPTQRAHAARLPWRARLAPALEKVVFPALLLGGCGRRCICHPLKHHALPPLRPIRLHPPPQLLLIQPPNASLVSRLPGKIGGPMFMQKLGKGGVPPDLHGAQLGGGSAVEVG
ncbi:hypothetical protein B0H19DRAFT_1085177 [Mycena capillaripes]|nr:hypothetical protein B0H19DRAFT_1085177 [Mycena capillaripes]